MSNNESPDLSERDRRRSSCLAMLDDKIAGLDTEARRFLGQIDDALLHLLLGRAGSAEGIDLNLSTIQPLQLSRKLPDHCAALTNLRP